MCVSCVSSPVTVTAADMPMSTSRCYKKKSIEKSASMMLVYDGFGCVLTDLGRM